MVVAYFACFRNHFLVYGLLGLFAHLVDCLVEKLTLDAFVEFEVYFLSVHIWVILPRNSAGKLTLDIRLAVSNDSSPALMWPWLVRPWRCQTTPRSKVLRTMYRRIRSMYLSKSGRHHCFSILCINFLLCLRQITIFHFNKLMHFHRHARQILVMTVPLLHLPVDRKTGHVLHHVEFEVWTGSIKDLAMGLAAAASIIICNRSPWRRRYCFTTKLSGHRVFVSAKTLLITAFVTYVLATIADWSGYNVSTRSHGLLSWFARGQNILTGNRIQI